MHFLRWSRRQVLRRFRESQFPHRVQAAQEPFTRRASKPPGNPPNQPTLVHLL